MYNVPGGKENVSFSEIVTTQQEVKHIYPSRAKQSSCIADSYTELSLHLGGNETLVFRDDGKVFLRGKECSDNIAIVDAIKRMVANCGGI